MIDSHPVSPAAPLTDAQALTEIRQALAEFADGRPFTPADLIRAAATTGRSRAWLMGTLGRWVGDGVLDVDLDTLTYRVIDLQAGPGRGDDLDGLAELTGRLNRAAGVPGALVTVDAAGQTGAWSYTDPCTGSARIEVGADLLADLDQVRLMGALAHEVAHHALGHTSAPSLWGSRTVLVAAAVAAVAAAPLWLTFGAAAAAVALYLFESWEKRREELAADAYSIVLLDRAGLPGRHIVAATLALLPDDGRWYRRVGWIAGTYPTTTERRRALIPLPRAPRRWLPSWNRPTR